MLDVKELIEANGIPDGGIAVDNIDFTLGETFP